MNGNDAPPIPLRITIANSTSLRVGDVVRVNTAGFVVASGATGLAAGVVQGFVDETGINPFSLGYKTGNPSVTLTGDDGITTSSSNQTAAHYMQAEVILDPAGVLLFLNKTDGTLTQSNLFQYFPVDSNSRQIATGSASDANGTFQLIALDPESTGGATADGTKGAFRLAGNQYGNLADNATAKIVA